MYVPVLTASDLHLSICHLAVEHASLMLASSRYLHRQWRGLPSIQTLYVWRRHKIWLLVPRVETHMVLQGYVLIVSIAPGKADDAYY